MAALDQREGDLDGPGSEAPRAEPSDFEPPSLTVIGTVQELTEGPGGTVSDGIDFQLSF
jgi:hypothetical protein